jgi:hypothetical protein
MSDEGQSTTCAAIGAAVFAALTCDLFVSVIARLTPLESRSRTHYLEILMK